MSEPTSESAALSPAPAMPVKENAPAPAMLVKEIPEATAFAVRKEPVSLRALARRQMCRCRGVCSCRRRRRVRGQRRSTPLARSVLAVLEHGGTDVQALLASALLAVRASSSPLAAARLLVDVQADSPATFAAPSATDGSTANQGEEKGTEKKEE